MNIALVIFNADPQRGGAERYTADVAAALARRGHQVDLIASRFGPPIDGVKFVSLDAKAPTRAGRFPIFLNSLDAHLRGQKYDLIHSMLPVRRCDIYHPHAGMAKAALESHLSRPSAPSRALAQLANRLNRKRQLFAMVEEALLHGPEKPFVICLSDYVKGMILKYYPDISGQFVKLFNGTDLVAFDPATHLGGGQMIRKRYKIPQDATVALMIAQHFERKGLGEVIEATANLAKASPSAAPTILVVGQDDPGRSREQAKRLGVIDKMIFAGQTDRAADFYAASDFFVLPTRHDSCSLVVLEALAMGLPAISTVFNGACEIMNDGEHGFVLANPADVPALTEAMGRLMDPIARQRMHEACLALRPNLSFDAHMDRLEEIYRARMELLANR
ncbi:MAG: glycosyltransferase family 4 protein [Tepidisphaeraceae bacterium]|jgi:UDP-glucose:(heptosyl)LPS alpha-1,3-glucosyltransferase